MTPTTLMSAILLHAQMNGVESVSAIDRGTGDIVVLIRGTGAQAEALECDLRAVMPLAVRIRVAVDELPRASRAEQSGGLALSPRSYYEAAYPRRAVKFRETLGFGLSDGSVTSSHAVPVPIGNQAGE